ncbi:MAG: DUF6498-containing protein [Gammaproteobacteria bacterium]|nr:DUF6498-containing protein [Gammaproteobacteria bacterium]
MIVATDNRTSPVDRVQEGGDLRGLLLGRRGVSLAALLIVNLIPVLGVFLWQWDVGSLVILYWSENIIIGFYTLVKMVAKSPIGGFFMGMFFLIHYGGFCAVHGLFVLALTTEEMPPFMEGAPWPLFLVFVQLLVEVIGNVIAIGPPELIAGFVGLFVSHGISLFVNYYRGGEYQGQTTKGLMSAPYKRIVILHVAIIAGGFGVMALGSPIPLLLLLVALKLGLDVWLHLGERRRSHV